MITDDHQHSEGQTAGGLKTGEPSAATINSKRKQQLFLLFLFVIILIFFVDLFSLFYVKTNN